MDMEMGDMGMETPGMSARRAAGGEEEEMELRRGPWTVEEDLLLVNYIAAHGEGRWNSLAHCAGLKRTGKSCRLRWLNYLRPDVRRGNITAEEQLLILELHSRWGNRWSKIAQHLPGRTDNEIKNYWRTRVQKHAKQLKCDVNSKQFRDVMRHLWMPRLVEKIRADAAAAAATMKVVHQNVMLDMVQHPETCIAPSRDQVMTSPDTSSTVWSSPAEVSPGAQLSGNPVAAGGVPGCCWPSMQCGGAGTTVGEVGQVDEFGGSWSELLASAGGDNSNWLSDFEFGEFGENLWSLGDIWLQHEQQQQYC